MTTARSILSSFIKSKHGEGSRGGHITGHTKSGRAIYGAKDAHFGKTQYVPSGVSPHSVEGYTGHDYQTPSKGKLPMAVVPLSDGHTARRIVHELFMEGDADGEGGTKMLYAPKAGWAVHAPDGAKTEHQLSHSFLGHPNTKAIEDEHDHEFVGDWMDTHH